MQQRSLVQALVVGLSLGLAGQAMAQERRGNPRDDGGRRVEQRHDARRAPPPQFHRGPPPQQHVHRPAPTPQFQPRPQVRPVYVQPRAHWQRGQRLAPAYRGHAYVVDYRRARHLQPPPRGYQWMGVNGDYLLVAIATGIIAQVMLNAY